MVMESDPRKAINSLREESSQSKSVSALCHDVLHEIGRTAFQKYESFKTSAKFQSDFCNSGYIHGVFESYFKSTDTPLAEITDQCNKYASVGGRQFDLWQCQHGVGHGLMYLTGGDLDESLTLCEKGFKNKVSQNSCKNGVYMEIFNLEVLAKEQNFVDPEDPFHTCATRDTAKADCYLYIPTYLSQTKEMNFAAIFKECEKAEPGYKDSCIRGIGSEAMKRNVDDPKKIFSLCEKAGSLKNQWVCIAGAVGMYMNQTGSYEAGKSLCERAPLKYRSICNKFADNKKELFE